MSDDAPVIPRALNLPSDPDDWYELRELLPDGEYRVPHDDPREYEYAHDFAFPNVEAARAYVEDYVQDDPGRREEVAYWFVVRMSMEIVG